MSLLFIIEDMAEGQPTCSICQLCYKCILYYTTTHAHPVHFFYTIPNIVFIIVFKYYNYTIYFHYHNRNQLNSLLWNLICCECVKRSGRWTEKNLSIMRHVTLKFNWKIQVIAAFIYHICPHSYSTWFSNISFKLYMYMKPQCFHSKIFHVWEKIHFSKYNLKIFFFVVGFYV